jgi:hypothetical protein
MFLSCFFLPPMFPAPLRPSLRAVLVMGVGLLGIGVLLAYTLWQTQQAWRQYRVAQGCHTSRAFAGPNCPQEWATQEAQVRAANQAYQHSLQATSQVLVPAVPLYPPRSQADWVLHTRIWGQALADQAVRAGLVEREGAWQALGLQELTEACAAGHLAPLGCAPAAVLCAHSHTLRKVLEALLQAGIKAIKGVQVGSCPVPWQLKPGPARVTSPEGGVGPAAASELAFQVNLVFQADTQGLQAFLNHCVAPNPGVGVHRLVVHSDPKPYASAYGLRLGQDTTCQLQLCYVYRVPQVLQEPQGSVPHAQVLPTEPALGLPACRVWDACQGRVGLFEATPSVWVAEAARWVAATQGYACLYRPDAADYPWTWEGYIQGPHQLALVLCHVPTQQYYTLYQGTHAVGPKEPEAISAHPSHDQLVGVYAAGPYGAAATPQLPSLLRVDHHPGGASILLQDPALGHSVRLYACGHQAKLLPIYTTTYQADRQETCLHLLPADAVQIILSDALSPCTLCPITYHASSDSLRLWPTQDTQVCLEPQKPAYWGLR